jgi:hypothetical protein
MAYTDPLEKYRSDIDPLARYRSTPSAADKPDGNWLTDTARGIGAGALDVVSKVPTGIADIALGAMGLNRPAERITSAIGERTGFQPGAYADEIRAGQSQALKAAQAETERVGSDPNASVLDIAGAYLKNPRALSNLVAESFPSMLAGGLGGRLLLGPGIVGAAAGEGGIMAGQSMSSIDRNVDPEKAALASLAVGGIGGLIGGAGGKLAKRLGFSDIDVLGTGSAAGLGSAAVAVPLPLPLGCGLEPGVSVTLNCWASSAGRNLSAIQRKM